MKRIAKRLIGLLCAVVILVSAVNISAFALTIQDKPDTIPTIDVEWHNPTKIMSVHNIRALENYIVFLYSGNKLAVFESFEIDNAYYVFSCEDFDLLLSQITKTIRLMTVLSFVSTMSLLPLQQRHLVFQITLR